MIWNTYGPYYDVGSETAERAERKTENLGAELRAMQQRLDRLSLACQAMWELLRSVSDLTEEELEQKILEVDLRDGQVDGKLNAQVVQCPACGRNTNTKRNVCIMCGAPIKTPHKFIP